ncbi:dicarboxylate transporter/tellurite-resistance protein TehA [soil metagenome]
MTQSVADAGVQRIPLNTFAISFGLAGLAAVWSIASTTLSWPPAIAEVFWAIAAGAWVWLILAHTVRGARSGSTLLSQLKHPAQGPIASIVPAVGMLLGAQLHTFWPAGGTALVAISIAVAALFAGWLLSVWISSPLAPESVHGAYLLPTAGSSLIAASASFKVGLVAVSMGAFAVGMFFSVVIITMLLARLAFLTPLPGALAPTMAIILAPPAVGGTAWFTMNGLKADAVSLSLLGILVIMILIQLFLIDVYRNLTFTLGFWSFTFPIAATAAYGIEWFALVHFPGWQAAIVVSVAACTALVVAVAVRSLVLIAGKPAGERAAEASLRTADKSVEA